jgi:hypothetical protein
MMCCVYTDVIKYQRQRPVMEDKGVNHTQGTVSLFPAYLEGMYGAGTDTKRYSTIEAKQLLFEGPNCEESYWILERSQAGKGGERAGCNNAMRSIRWDSVTRFLMGIDNRQVSVIVSGTQALCWFVPIRMVRNQSRNCAIPF